MNTMIEDNSIECEDSKILNTHQDFNVATNAVIALQNSAAKKELIEHSESWKTTPPPSKDDDSVKDDSVIHSISSEQVTVVENIDRTVPKIVNFSDVSDDGECGSLKYFDEVYSSDKHERFPYYTGSRLLPVQLLQVPGYSKQVFLWEEHTSVTKMPLTTSSFLGGSSDSL